ncbi:MAG TPA: chemotaxis protein CheD [Syntrophorhabdales bacterium]|nr:chemotaxis protein CheD [Syntrophorhabdales bacterium]
MKVFLKPGEIYIGEKPADVSTILGSCVSVTMFSRRAKVGAICHALLPSGHRSAAPEGFRYVDTSILYMLGILEKRGIRGSELEIRLLGGSDMLECTRGNSDTVGRKNIETALRILKGRNLEVSGSDVGGFMGRKVRFSTATGRVLLRRIRGAIQ